MYKSRNYKLQLRRFAVYDLLNTSEFVGLRVNEEETEGIQ